MAVKAPANKYGLWHVEVAKVAGSRTAKPKSVAVIESNLKGVEKWLEDNGLRPERHQITLLPEVEYVDPVNDRDGALGTGGIRQLKRKPSKTIPVTKTKLSPAQVRRAARLAKIQQNRTNRRSKVTVMGVALPNGYCRGSGVVFPRSDRGRKKLCTHCLKMMQVNYSNGEMRRHKP